jgi:transposase
MSEPDVSRQGLGISEEDWQQTPPSVRALVGVLHKRLAKVEEQLKLNSDTSSQPPSSDKPRHKPEQKGKLPSGKKRGAQPGHRGHRRKPLPPERVDEFRVYQPDACRHCGTALCGQDPQPRRWQVTDIPPLRPMVTEHQVHRLTCSCCGKSTAGQLPPAVASSQFGPRITALIGLLMGQERLSKRQVKRVLKTLLAVDISVGAVVARQQEVSESLAPTYEAVVTHVHQSRNRNIDETPWDEDWQRAWLWSAVGDAATLFHIAPHRDQATAQSLLGDNPDSVSTSDRFTAYNGLDPDRHQTCWAHLMRTFRRFQLRDGPSQRIGGMLEIYGDYLLHRWRAVKRGHLSRVDFRTEVPQHQADIRRWLELGACSSHQATAGTCRRLLRQWPILWTFTRYEGVEPTNNAVERALRPAVIWRKLCYGTASAAGSRFVERILTVVATTRQQGRDLLDFLSMALSAHRQGASIPALL